MADAPVFRLVLHSSSGDRAVLVVTFLLTVFVDLSIAIAAGVVLASLLFAHNMARLAEANTLLPQVADDVDEFAQPNQNILTRAILPPGVEAFRLSGPFFFAVAQEFEEILSRSGGYPKVLILRMESVPLIDATGAASLKRFIKAASARGTSLVLCELKPQPAAALREMDVTAARAPNFAEAIEIARSLAASV